MTSEKGSSVARHSAESNLPVGDAVAPATERRPNHAELSGGGVTLLPVDAARDGEALYRISHGSPRHDDIWTYMGYGPFAHAAAMHEWLASIEASTDPLFFTVFSTRDPETGAPSREPKTAGMVSFLNIEPTHRRLELGHIWYGLAFQRTHVNTAAIALMLEHTFEELSYRRAEWKCDALNARSRAAARRLGFQAEGVFRQHIIYKGRNRDTAWFSMLDWEWPARRAALREQLRI